MELCKVTFVSCLGVQGYYVTLIPEPYREEVWKLLFIKNLPELGRGWEMEDEQAGLGGFTLSMKLEIFEVVVYSPRSLKAF